MGQETHLDMGYDLLPASEEFSAGNTGMTEELFPKGQIFIVTHKLQAVTVMTKLDFSRAEVPKPFSPQPPK